MIAEAQCMMANGKFQLELRQAKQEVLETEDQHSGFVIKVKVSTEGKEYDDFNLMINF